METEGRLHAQPCLLQGLSLISGNLHVSHCRWLILASICLHYYALFSGKVYAFIHMCIINECPTCLRNTFWYVLWDHCKISLVELDAFFSRTNSINEMQILALQNSYTFPVSTWLDWALNHQIYCWSSIKTLITRPMLLPTMLVKTQDSQKFIICKALQSFVSAAFDIQLRRSDRKELILPNIIHPEIVYSSSLI